jgi:hypothetical protein
MADGSIATFRTGDTSREMYSPEERGYHSLMKTRTESPVGEIAMVTVHIGLSRELQEQLVRGGTVGIEEFARGLGVSLAPQQPERVELFGILTVRAPVSRIPAIAAIAGVDFVTPDKERRVAASAS